MVLDQAALERLPLPLANPERIVLITQRDPHLMAEAWEAGVVSVVSEQDPDQHRPAGNHGGRFAC